MADHKRALLARAWSDLPPDIVSNIERRLDCAVDVTQLRSVCKNWHSSRNPNNNSILSPFLPMIVPNLSLPFTDDRPNAPITLIARAVFLVKPLQYSPDSHGWFLTVEEVVPGKLRILYPLSKDPVKNLPSDCPKYLDLSEFRVSQIAKSFGFKYESDGKDVPNVLRVVLCSDFTAMVLYGGGTLIGLSLKSGNWSFVCHSIISSFSDVISYGAVHLRAVDYQGNVYIIDHKVMKTVKTIVPTSEIRESDRIILIRSNGELFAVVYLKGSNSNQSKFEIYQLDEVQCKWIDYVDKFYCSKVLFISSDWSFFVYNRDLDLRHYLPRPKLTDYDDYLDWANMKETMSGDYVIYSENSFGCSRYSFNTTRLYDEGTSVDLQQIHVFFSNRGDSEFWHRAHCCRTTTINVLWPPPTWFWPDTCLSTSKNEQSPSCATRVVTANKKLIALGNSLSLGIQLSKEENSRVVFQGIEVRSEQLPIVQDIWKKHGDIFEGSILQSCVLKAMALECLAKIVITLQTPGEGFTADQIAYVESTLGDLQAMRLKLGWLVPVVENILTLHKQLQADLLVLEEAKAKAEKAKAKAEKTGERLIAMMRELL